MTEAELLDAVLELARLRGWAVAHFRPSRTARGWRTAVQGDGVGFPDLVLARRREPWHEREVLYWELKAEGGQLTVEQRHWQGLLGGRVVRPSDWASGNVERWLT